jgi:hypothetical protein
VCRLIPWFITKRSNSELSRRSDERRRTSQTNSWLTNLPGADDISRLQRDRHFAARLSKAMLPYLDRHFGNPSSVHAAGRLKRAPPSTMRAINRQISALETARNHFTGGGTESQSRGARPGSVSGVARWPHHFKQSGAPRGSECA